MNILFKIRRIIACLLVRKQKPLNLSQAVVSFSFDDVPDSAFENGQAILKKYGYQATYYISLGLADKTRQDEGYFDIKHLKGVVDDGGELGCHTFDHIHFYQSNKKQIINSLSRNQEKMDEIIPGYKFTNFSYPYGEQTFISKLLIRARFMSARGVKGGINFGPVDLNNLKAVQLDQSTTFEKISSKIEEAVKRKGWLIFYTHDIQENPSTDGCTPAYFEKIVQYCSEKKIQVSTIRKVINLIRVKGSLFIYQMLFLEPYSFLSA